MTFTAQDASFAAAAEAYHRLWSDEGTAIVYEGISMRAVPMYRCACEPVTTPTENDRRSFTAGGA